MFVIVHLVFKWESRVAQTVCHRQILQRALAPFITNRTVKWMAGEQEFDDRIPCFQHPFGIGANVHPICHTNRTTGLHTTAPVDFLGAIVVHNRLARRPIKHRHSDIDQTHTAHADRL